MWNKFEDKLPEIEKDILVSDGKNIYTAVYVNSYDSEDDPWFGLMHSCEYCDLEQFETEQEIPFVLKTPQYRYWMDLPQPPTIAQHPLCGSPDGSSKSCAKCSEYSWCEGNSPECYENKYQYYKERT